MRLKIGLRRQGNKGCGKAAEFRGCFQISEALGAGEEGKKNWRKPAESVLLMKGMELQRIVPLHTELPYLLLLPADPSIQQPESSALFRLQTNFDDLVKSGRDLTDLQDVG